MHLVLGSDRIDLEHRVVVIARAAATSPGADLIWVDAPVPGAPAQPFGADATTADDVRRLARAGATALGVSTAGAAAREEAIATGLTLLGDAALVGAVPPERLLVPGTGPVDGAVACLDLVDHGPAAWGRATVALAAGVRVVRTSEPRSLRRVAVVVERLTAGASA